MADTGERPLAIVTGGSRGIGRAVVRQLAGNGYDVGFSFARNSDAAREVEAGLTADRRNAWGVRWDQADADGASGFFDAVLAKAGRRTFDVLVANAGTIDHAALADTSVARYDRLMAVNARGTFFALQAGARRIADGGRIVCISSMATSYPSPGEAVYAASKAAIEQFCRVASRELGGRGITANCVAPGPTDTDMLRANVDEATKAQVAAMTALRRLGEPDDVAAAVMAFILPQSRWLTGQIARADGGLT